MRKRQSPCQTKTMKKCSKNLLAAAAAAIMMVAPMVPATAFAADSAVEAAAGQNTEGSTNLKYEVTSSYTWTVPTEIDFGSNAGANQTVTKENNTVAVTKNVIAEGKKLSIGIDKNQDFTIKLSNGTTTLNYTISKVNEQTQVSKGEEILSVAAGTNTGNVELRFVLTTKSDAEVAGSYTGTVKYTASVVDVSTGE